MGHLVVTGLGYGDCGKGSIVDWVCATRDVKAVIRHNGGPQCGHNVVLPDGTHHTFSQFGSGTLRGVPTHLSRFMLVNPFNLAREADAIWSLGFPDPLTTTTVSRDALLVTPLHRAANRFRERARGAAAHGSCGQGVGEAVAYDLANPGDAPRVGDIRNLADLREKLELLRQRLVDHHVLVLEDGGRPLTREMTLGYASLSTRLELVDDDWAVPELLDKGDCVFEGAQGVLLDQDYGFHPHTTWSRTTDANALELLGGREAVRLGVTRTYGTRHGAGPFPGEDPRIDLPELHNDSAGFQGAWRQGRLNLAFLSYAVRANKGVDQVALTHCDQPILPVETSMDEVPLVRNQIAQGWLGRWLMHTRFDITLPDDLEELGEMVERAARAPVGALSFGPTAEAKVVTSRSLAALA